MNIFKTKEDISQFSDIKKRNSKTICLVPTMGYFHQGHISLMEKGKKLCDELVVSLFVNPTQFGPNEDLDSYPMDIDRDLSIARKIGAAAVFMPDKADMYPNNFQTSISLSQLPGYLCGKSRPTHFAGVATVVAKLFNIVKPDVAVFGKKDFQQLKIIRQLTCDMDMNIKIVAGDIVREPDGIAMSSRNAYLKEGQRESALSLYKSLEIAKEAVKNGELKAHIIKDKLKAFIESFDETQIDYISFCDPNTLKEVDSIEKTTLLALAVKVGTTRLIDNALIDPLQ
ncbi:MAG: pantoate--beta-alanine ligase [Desulfobacteraceae bacterium]|nr:pantoate--beta-alanine ligase [Desulfobacteraceae bacterium]